MNEDNKKVNNSFYMLVLVIIASTTCGIFVPQIGLWTEPYLLLWLGLLLLFNLIKMNMNEMFAIFIKPRNLIVLSFFKLVGIPVGLFIIMTLVQEIGFPISDEIKLSVFLLAGVSTGLGSPFVVNFVGGNLPLVVGLIISSSLLVPFILPSLVFTLFNDKFVIPLFEMIFLLMIALITPLTISQLIKKYSPVITKYISNTSQGYSLVFIFMINVSIFGIYSSYFFSNPIVTFENVVLTFVLFGFFTIVGYGVGKFLGFRQDEMIGSIISMTYVNNILMVVFAHQFFGAEVASLAAFFNIPYYVGILILRKVLRSNTNLLDPK